MIREIEKIDVVEVIEPGTINLNIIYDTWMNNSIDTQIQLMDKVEFYLDTIKTSEFRKQYSISEETCITIVLQLKYEPTDLIKELSRRIAEWTEFHGAMFAWEVIDNIK